MLAIFAKCAVFSVPHDTHRTPHTQTTAAVTLKSFSLHCGVAARNLMASHRRSARERRAQRARAEARFADGGTPASGFTPSHALVRVMADLQERVSERIVEQTIDNPEPAVDALVPQAMEGIVEGDVAFALAVTYAAPSTVIGYVDPTPAVAHATPAPVVELVAPAPALVCIRVCIRGACSSVCIRGSSTCRRPCEMSSGDRACGSSTCRRPCDTSSSDRACGSSTCRRPCDTSSSDRACGSSTCRLRHQLE